MLYKKFHGHEPIFHNSLFPGVGREVIPGHGMTQKRCLGWKFRGNDILNGLKKHHVVRVPGTGGRLRTVVATANNDKLKELEAARMDKISFGFLPQRNARSGNDDFEWPRVQRISFVCTSPWLLSMQYTRLINTRVTTFQE
jgi:hypothetical protein